MIRTYKEFKKAEEFFWGLSLFTWLKIAALTIALVYLALSLKLGFNNPLLLFLSILWMIVISFVIKSSLDNAVPGFYSSFLTHPFANHVFKTLPNTDGYKSVLDLQNLKTINHDHIVSKEADLISVLKLNNGISWNKSTSQERDSILETWASYLAQLQSIDSINSYLLNSNLLEDVFQCFIWVKPYQLQLDNVNYSLNHNLAEMIEINQEWQDKVFGQDQFIASPEFYIIIRHKNNKNKNQLLYKVLSNFVPESWLSFLIKNDFNDLETEYKLLEQKLATCLKSLNQIGIAAEPLLSNDLIAFCDHWLLSKQLNGQGKNRPVLKHSFDVQVAQKKVATVRSARVAFGDNSDFQNKSNDDLLIDRSKYLEFKGRLHKIYRFSVPPETGDIKFWLLNYLPLFSTESYISIYLQPRNAISDRRKAENKSEILKQMKTRSKVSTVNIIQENQELAKDLIDRPYSFDLVIYIGVSGATVKELQDIDNLIRKPMKQTCLDSLDRQQVNNWLYSLPFAYNKLSNSEKLFANLDFAKSCFSFVDNDLGTPAGPLLATALVNAKPVYLNEYDTAYCHNRAINFIGDSGSGKTVAAKLAIKRRLQESNRRFYIIDNTEDGWQFFVDFFGGEIIEIDKYGLDEPLFAPFACRAKPGTDDFLKHIEDLLKLFAVMKDNQAKLDSGEKVFLTNKIHDLYYSYETPSLSDFYECLCRSENEDADKWRAVISPYCQLTGGIYSKLMDGTQSHLDNDIQLRLFCFSKLNPDSNFLPVSLFLLSNFIENKISVDKHAGITLVIDEAWKIFTNKDSEHGKQLLIHLARAGRGLDLGLWTISQKPSDIPREIHSSASVSLCFQLKEARDKSEISAYANLNQTENQLLHSPLMNERGIALLKTTRSSGLVKLTLDPCEAVLCNSTRDFVNRRSQLLTDLKKSRTKAEACLQVVKELAC
ncbi:MAG: ATP-binding protein [Cyanobacteria bacterium]|nr:ATP-binding protein [Cyanobacteriota bacterium]MDA1019915.1 ATP-binding protein [Cyanobacteriota bacterium]